MSKIPGKKLFRCASDFYETLASWNLIKELKTLSIVMRICETVSLAEAEEQKALNAFEELKEGLEDGTIKRKGVFPLLKLIQENLTEKNIKSRIVSQLMELEYSCRPYDINLEKTIDHIIENITSLPSINAKAISREIALLQPKTTSPEKLEKTVKQWLSTGKDEV